MSVLRDSNQSKKHFHTSRYSFKESEDDERSGEGCGDKAEGLRGYANTDAASSQGGLRDADAADE